MKSLTDTMSIGAAAELSGLTSRQIRYLEERNYIQPIYIDVNGQRQRRYTRQQVDKLAYIARLRSEGYEIIAAVKLSYNQGGFCYEDEGTGSVL